MASKKYQILCQKCTEIKNKKAVKFRANDDGKEKSKNPESNVRKQRHRSKTIWKKLAVTKQNSVRTSSKSGLNPRRSKRSTRDSPHKSMTEDSVCTCQSPVFAEITQKNGILKRRASSADAAVFYPNTTVPPIKVNSCRIGEQEEGPGSRTHRVPSLGSFEKRPKKIRFKIPEGTLGYEDAKKAMWRSGKERAKNRIVGVKGVPTRYPTAVSQNSLGSPSEAIRKIMPVLERFKIDDDRIENELDLNKIARYIRQENEKARRREKLAREEHLEESEQSERELTEEDSELESDMKESSEDGFPVKSKRRN